MAVALAAAACIIVLSGLGAKYLLLFCLMVAALAGLLLMNVSGVLYPVLFFGIGVSLIINPNKFIGPVDERHFGGAPGIFMSLFDLGVAVIVLLRLSAGARVGAGTLKRVLPLAVLLGVYACAMCISAARVADERLLAAAQIVFEGRSIVFFFLMASGFLFTGAGARRDVLLLLSGVAAGILVEGGIVLAEYRGVLPRGVSVLGIEAGGFREMLDVGTMNRVGGTYRHPNFLAIAMVLVLPLFFAAFLALRGWLKALFGAAACAAASILVLTLSRGGFLAAGVSLAVMCLLLSSTPAARAVLRRNAAWIVLCAAVVCAVAAAYSGPIYKKLFQSSSVNISSRAELNSMALQMIESSPATGIGINYSTYGGRGFAYYDVYLAAFGLPPVVHNIYLLIAAEIGIPGAAAFVGFIILLLARAYARFAAMRDETTALLLAGAACGIIAYCVADLFEASLRKIEIAYLFWWCAGLAAFFTCAPQAGAQKKVTPYDRRR